MTELNQLLGFVPEKYRSTVVLIVAVSPYVTRSIYALMNGRGLKGVLSSIWLGTNVPKQKTVPGGHGNEGQGNGNEEGNQTS